MSDVDTELEAEAEVAVMIETVNAVAGIAPVLGIEIVAGNVALEAERTENEVPVRIELSAIDTAVVHLHEADLVVGVADIEDTVDHRHHPRKTFPLRREISVPSSVCNWPPE